MNQLNHNHFLELLFSQPLRKHDYSKNWQNVVENKLYNVEISFKQITTTKKIVTIFKNLENI